MSSQAAFDLPSTVNQEAKGTAIKLSDSQTSGSSDCFLANNELKVMQTTFSVLNILKYIPRSRKSSKI